MASKILTSLILTILLACCTGDEIRSAIEGLITEPDPGPVWVQICFEVEDCEDHLTTGECARYREAYRARCDRVAELAACEPKEIDDAAK